MRTIEEFTEKLIIQFPRYRSAFENHVKFNDGFLSHIFYNHVISNHLFFLLWYNMMQIEVEELFVFLEEMMVNGNESVSNVIVLSVLPQLGDDKLVFERASKMMGPVTKKAYDDYTNRG